LSEKYSNLHVHSEKSVNDAHSEIEKLQNKLNGLCPPPPAQLFCGPNNSLK
jgi:hypothetical protein